MTGDKIYEYDLDITGVTDTLSTWSHLAGRKDPRRRARFTWLLRETRRPAYRGECAASIISGCAATDASTSTSARHRDRRRSPDRSVCGRVAVLRPGEPDRRSSVKNVTLTTERGFAWSTRTKILGVGA